MIRPRYSYVFFDWDGTLAQTLEAWIDAKQETFAEYGVELTRHEVGETLGNLTIHNEKYGLDLVEYDTRMLAKVEEHLAHVPLYDGAFALLQKLYSSGIKLAILTTNTRERLEYDINRLGVKGFFDYIITADETTKHKPNPEIIEKAAKHFGANLDQVLMVGDSSKDLGAANSAGVDAALFHHPDLHGGFYDIMFLKSEFNPKYVVEDLSELASIILEGKS